MSDFPHFNFHKKYHFVRKNKQKNFSGQILKFFSLHLINFNCSLNSQPVQVCVLFASRKCEGKETWDILQREVSQPRPVSAGRLSPYQDCIWSLCFSIPLGVTTGTAVTTCIRVTSSTVVTHSVEDKEYHMEVLSYIVTYGREAYWVKHGMQAKVPKF